VPETGPARTGTLEKVVLEITLLGNQRVAAGGQPLDALSPRTLGLLGHLVVHAGSPQLRSHVAAIFWPDSTDAQARTNLRRELHQLRRALPDGDRFMTIDTSSLCWRPDAECEIDVAEFEAAAAEADRAEREGDQAVFRAAGSRAVRAYGGDLMPAFYDDWVLVERERLHRTCVALLDRLVTALADDGDTPAAIELARRRVGLEPLEESGYRTLMELQARSGDRAAALRTFHRCASVLERDLGVAPSAETVAAHRLLLGGSVEMSPAGGDAPFIGRQAELAALRSAWASARNGPRVMIVAGEAGLGKSRVVDELARSVGREMGTVAKARCFPSMDRLTLAPVVEWLRSRPLRDGVERLDPIWRSEIARLRHDVHSGTGRRASSAPIDPWQRLRFFEALTRGVLSPGAPTLLVLDDLQWCDTETLEWLEFLLHFDPDAPVLVVATLRSEELPERPEVWEYTRRLRSEGCADELTLDPLTTEGTAELAAALLGRQLRRTERVQLHARTGGIPLFVVESSRPDSAESSRVDAVLAGRFAKLSPLATELCGVAAAIEGDFSYELMAEASDLTGEELVEALEELWRRRIVQEHSSTSYGFVHDLLRQAAYDRLSPPQRAQHHRAVASALERLHAGDPGVVAAQIAEHYQRGGEVDGAIRHHWLAAEAASSVFAHGEAIRHQSEALSLLDQLGEGNTVRRATGLLGLGVAQRHAGDPAHHRTLLAAADLARRLGAADLLATAALAVADHGYWSPSFSPDPERVGLVRAALRSLPEDEPASRAQMLAVLAIEMHLDGALEEAATLVDEAERIARDLGDPEVLLGVLATRCYATQNPATLTTLPEVATECVQLAEQLGDQLRLAHEYLRLDSHLRKVGETAGAQAALDRATSFAERFEHPPTAFWVANNWLARALYEGDPAEATRRADEVDALGRSIGFSDTDRRSLYASFSTSMLSGRLAELEPLLDHGLVSPTGAPVVRAGGAMVLVAAGRADEARLVFEEIEDQLDDVPFSVNWHITLCFMAHLARALGDRSRADRIHDRLLPYPGLVLHTGPAVCGTTDHGLGLAAVAAGRLDDALEHFTRADELQERAGMRGWLMFTRLERARALIAAERDPDHAVELLRAARRTAQVVGNHEVLDEASVLASQVPSTC
jgi:DNA-binding SARP family transcriptional activator/tetratricopeptide (TPR) repeat protein